MRFYALLIIAQLAAGCVPPQSAKKNEKPLRAAAASAGDISGRWSTGCVNLGEESGKHSVELTNGIRTSTIYLYSDGECKIEASVEVIIGNYVIGKTVNSPTGAREFDSTETKITVTPKSEASVTSFQEEYGEDCSVSFMRGKPTDISPALCSKESTIFRTYYTIYRVNRSGLILGNCSKEDSPMEDCSTPGRRAKDFDMDTLMTRS